MPQKTIEIRPIDAALGAEIEGVDLSRPLDAGILADIQQAFTDHLVLFFRDQNLTPEQQIAFSARLGTILYLPFVEPLSGYPEIIAVLKEAEETGISTFGGMWHSDFSFLVEPPAGSILYALDVPARGGDTRWANMYAAYEALPQAMRARLDGMTAIHSGLPYGTKAPPPPEMGVSTSIKITRGDPAADIETEQPVVRRHPETGRKALFINTIYTAGFKGLGAAESRALLGELQAHATQPKFTCHFSWRPGSLALWDNRWTQHLAANDYDGERRLLHRTTLAGERPLWPNQGERPS